MLSFLGLVLLGLPVTDDHGAVYADGPRIAAVPLEAPDVVDFAVTFRPGAEHLQVFFDQGLCQFYTGWFFEAERAFLTILKDDPDCAMAFWGMALANQERPLRAAWFARAGWLKRGLASPRERQFLDALARFYSVDGPHEPADLPEPRQAAPGEEVGEGGEDPPLEVDWTIRRPDLEAAERLFADYSAIMEEDADCIEAKALLVAHCIWASEAGYSLKEEAAAKVVLSEICANDPAYPVHGYSFLLGTHTELRSAVSLTKESWSPSVRSWTGAGRACRERGEHVYAMFCTQAAVRAGHAQATLNWSLPTAIPGYNEAAELWWKDEAAEGARLISNLIYTSAQALPRHPRHGWPAVDPSRSLVELDSSSLSAWQQRDIVDPVWLGPARWEPPRASPWTLDDAFGEVHSLSDYKGRSLLVINFLGMGCVHCMEQLQAVIPFADKFQKAGIDIVAIGVQTPEQLSVSIGTDPEETGYPFPILCDPDLDQFKGWHAYDDFAATALHGTYLVDGSGTVRWIDISHLPFMDIEFLLTECSRLIGVGK